LFRRQLHLGTYESKWYALPECPIYYDLLEPTIEQLETLIADYTEAHVEYETTHPDAGNDYAHLVRESYGYRDIKSDIREFAKDNDIATEGWIDDHIEEIIEACLDRFEMTSGDIYGPDDSNVLTLDSFPCGEVECEIDLNQPPFSAVDTQFQRHLAACWLHYHGSDVCLRYSPSPWGPITYSYEETDAAWYATIDADTFKDICNDIWHAKSDLEYSAHFDRWDIVEAHYFWNVKHHSGMSSPEYARQCHISRYFKPSPLACEPSSENARAIYHNLCVKAGCDHGI
jgi:hypothetical protein